jgi:hypothetical protein
MLRHETYGCVWYKKQVYNLDDKFDMVRILIHLILDGVVKITEPSEGGELYEFKFKFIHPDFIIHNQDITKKLSSHNNMQYKTIIYNLNSKILIPLTEDEYTVFNKDKGER